MKKEIKSFKLVTGFSAEDYFEIEKTELSRAYYAFLTGGDFITKEGIALRGRNILRIEPNWNAIMGWNAGYKPKALDLQEIGSKRKNYAYALMSAGKECAREVVATKNTNLLDQPLKISLPKPKKLFKEI